MSLSFYGVDKHIRITPAQILKLEKAIGYNLATVKRRIHRMCYNFCEVGVEPDEDWEQLRELGLATRSVAFGRYFYRATQRGIDLIGMVTGCKIYTDKNMWTGKELEDDDPD